jgi:membrane dipeptidase
MGALFFTITEVPMPFIIDAHEDLAYNILNFGRDYRRAAEETRQLEAGTPIPEQAEGQALIGWPNYQRGQVAVVFGTLFLSPKKYSHDAWEKQAYASPQEARKLHSAQIDVYERLCEGDPDKFQLVRNRAELSNVLKLWQDTPAAYPQVTHPVGIVMLMEGAEGVANPGNLEEWWERGVRLIGPVWAGGRYFGGTKEPGQMTSEGRDLLSKMAELGFILDLSHMSEESVLQALDFYPGTVIASHANCKALLKDFPTQRHFTDQAIQRLVERGGVMGVVLFNVFLSLEWKMNHRREEVTLDLVVAQIDHICQIAGDARHVAIGTDFDGGYGWPAVPLEIDTIADLQKLAPKLAQRGYNQADIAAIFGTNWQHMLEGSLPR